MKSKNILFILFLISPFVVFFDILFLNYTLAFNDVAADLSSRFGGLLPVADPAAGSLQDHPWLFKVAHTLQAGSIPFVNLDNGLGAPLLESMQSGVLYPLNFLLLFTNLSTSNFFDLFSILHVLILAINSLILFSLYTEKRIALICATAIALSPFTFTHINMVHYRAFVWTPLIIWGGLSIARERYSTVVYLTLISSIFCSITAGNPQESFLGLLISCVLFVFEVLRLKSIKLKPILIFLILLIAGVSISSPALLPYLTSQAQELMSSVGNDTSRSSALIHGPWLLGGLIPYVNGAYPDFYRSPSPHHDEMAVSSIHPIFIVLLISGLLVVFHKHGLVSKSEKIFFFLCFFATILAVSSISEFSPFTSLIAQLPFIKTIRLAKYTSYIYLLIALCSCISLKWLLNLSVNLKRHILFYSALLFILVVLSILIFQMQDQQWNFSFKHIEALSIIWAGFMFTLATFIWLLWTKEFFHFNWCMVVLIIGAIAMRPYGFPKERSSYTLFDQTYASQIELSDERILSTAPANANILGKYETISVFDPINNASIANLINTNFQTFNPYFWIQPTADTEINEQQSSLLKLMGVTLVRGYQLQSGASHNVIAENLVRLDNPLPRIFLIQPEASEKIQNSCLARDYSQALKLIRSSLLAQPLVYEKDINRIHFHLDASGQGILVALQAFTPAWKLNRISATPFCSGFSSWSGNFQAGKMYEIEYVPPGLQTSRYGVIGGVLLLIGAFKLKSVSLQDKV